MFRQYYGIPNDADMGDGFMSRFPILFQNRGLPQHETCMCWGIECPIGWYHIIEQLCTALEFHNMEFARNHRVAVVADQMKEKYGTLRFYFTVRDVDAQGHVVPQTGDESVDDVENRRQIAVDTLEMLANELIDEAERLTVRTCATCGTPLDEKNTVVTRGWISYICSACNEKRKPAAPPTPDASTPCK